MQQYMLKMYDGSGRFLGRIEFEAAEDAAAEGRIRRLQHGRSQELWCGTRWIASWPAREALAGAH
jgi:hypothetical protein